MNGTTMIEELLSDAINAGPAPEEAIAAAESALEVQFPKTYKTFLARFGAAVCDGFVIAGICAPPRPEQTPFWSNVVSDTMLARKASRGHIPKEYVAISDDGTDYSFYLDTSRMNELGECPVVVLGPGADGVVVAKDFNDFVIRAYMQRLVY